MGQIWAKPSMIQPNVGFQKPQGDDLDIPTPIQSQIETSDAHLSTIIQQTEQGYFQQQNQEYQNEHNQLQQHQIDIESTLQQPQNQGKQTKSPIANQLPLTHNHLLPLPQIGSHSAFESKQPSTFRSIQEQDQNNVQQLYNKLLTDFLPAEELKLMKKQQHKRTLILWLKELPESNSEQQRDKRLRGEGYQVYSTADITSLFAEYQQHEQLFLQVIVMFSYSQYYDNNETMKELVQYFLLANRISELIVVRPPEGAKLSSYKMHMNKLDVNHRIIQINYQIEIICNHILVHEPRQKSSCNFLPLSYWHNRKGLEKLLSENDSYTSMCIKSKINLYAFTKIGKSIVERIANDVNSFKTLAFHYSSLYDNYIHQMQTIQTKKDYLQRVGLIMIVDPVKFYLIAYNSLLIDRLLMLVPDRLQDITCILLPLILIFEKIRQEFSSYGSKRKYKNQFRCYYDLHLSTQQLHMFQQGQIIQNLSLLKAYLQPQKTYFNTHIIINVSAHPTSPQHDNGYCFVSENMGNLQPKQSAKKSYFSGYDGVLFNFLNSFRVIQRRYDSKHMKNIIELQYGYIARHIELKKLQDYVPSEHEHISYRPLYKQTPDIAAIIKYQSNQTLLQNIQDFGDCFSLLGEHSQAISYYQELYRQNKGDMKATPLLLAQIQEKKGINYELKRNHSMALDHYYKAFSYIHRGTITRQLQHIYSRAMSLMRGDGLFQKIVTFGQGIIRNSQRQKNWQYYSEHFKLELHQYLAVSYFSLTCVDYHCTSSDSRSTNHFQRGLQLIKQIGEYDKNVAVFYKQLGRYYLIKREPIEALTYLNKSLLILKTIHTEHHPILCELYEFLAVGYMQTHDYSNGLNNIQQCKRIYDLYYDENDTHRVPSFEIQAFISKKLGLKQETISKWRQQISVLRRKYRKDVSKAKLVELMYSDVVGILRNSYQKELQAQGKSILRMKKQVLSVGYCYAQISIIFMSQYKYKQAIFELTEALNIIKTEFPNEYSFQIQLKLMIAQCYLQQTMFRLFWDKVMNIKSDIQRTGMGKNQVTVKYHLLVASAHSCNQKNSEAFDSIVKAREAAGKIYGHNSLEYCAIVDMVGKYGIKAGKTHQASSYFNETQQIRNIMMTNIRLNRHTILLYGVDFEDYKAQVKLQLCYSIQNKAIILLNNGEIDQGSEKYIECIESLKEVVGEFHFYTAYINKELAKIHMKNKDNLTKALNLLFLSLSVFQNMTDQPLSELVDTYSCLAFVKESTNQLGQSIDAWAKVIGLLRKSHKLNKGVSFLKQFRRIVQLIMQHQNQNYYKMCYYAISSSFEEQKKNENIIRIASQEAAQLISQILSLSERLRQKISLETQFKAAGNENQQMIHLQSSYPTLEGIKLKMEERRKKRKALQNGS